VIIIPARSSYEILLGHSAHTSLFKEPCLLGLIEYHATNTSPIVILYCLETAPAASRPIEGARVGLYGAGGGGNNMCQGILAGLLLSSILLCDSPPASQALELLPDSISGDYLGQDPPGPQPALFAPGVVSTCKEHSAATFSPEGDEVYFGRMFPAVIYCMKRIGARWTEPFAMPFSGEYNDLYPSISPDGKKVFFSLDRPVEDGGGRLPRGQVRLWMCERSQEAWSDPVLLGDEINLGRRISAHSMSSSWTLFFTRSKDGTDIYQARGFGTDIVTVEKLAPGLISQALAIAHTSLPTRASLYYLHSGEATD
jgi:hypothetical protein